MQTKTLSPALREAFFSQMRSGTTKTEASCGAMKEQFQKTLDKIVAERAVDQVYPRHTSDNRLELLVRELEAGNAKEDKKLPDKKSASRVGLPSTAIARLDINMTQDPTANGNTKNGMNRLADAAEFDEVTDNREGLTAEQGDAMDEIDLEQESDEKRQYDSDEQDSEEVPVESSDDTAEDGEEDEDDAVAAVKSGRPKTGKKRGADSAATGSSSDDEDDEDFDENADNVLDGEEEVVAPKAKKAKKAESKPKKTATASTADPKKALQAKQAELKKKRAAEFKDAAQLERVEKTLIDYVYVATMQATKAAPNFRELLLRSQPQSATSKAAALVRSVTSVEARVQESITLLERAAPESTQEIIDFVKGATAVSDGPPAYAVSAKLCDITQTAAGDEKNPLICLQATHVVRADKTINKKKVVLARLRPLIEAVWFAVNLMAVAESMVVERLRHIKGFVNEDTSAADAAQLLANDKTHEAVYKKLRTKLRAALDKIDQPKQLEK